LIPSEVARRILTRDGPAIGTGTPESVGLALQGSCTRFTDALCDSMGEAGCAALLARAFARTEDAQPALKSLRGPDVSIAESARLDGIVASVQSHGVEVVTAALEALLTVVIEILMRLIGEEMTIRLIDHDGPEPRARGGGRVP
jgi:hypothetical protein